MVCNSPSAFLLFVCLALELCECLHGCPGLTVPDSPYGLCGRKGTLNNTCQSSGAV